jgi:hypothetical protein
MIEYKILSEDDEYDLEEKVNRYSRQGFVLTKFTVTAEDAYDMVYAAVMEREKS